MLKILQARLQQYVNRELPDIQQFQKNIYFCFIDYIKAFNWVDQNNCGTFLKRWDYQTTLPASWETCMWIKKQQLEPTWNNGLVPNWERSMTRLYIVTLLM